MSLRTRLSALTVVCISSFVDRSTFRLALGLVAGGFVVVLIFPLIPMCGTRYADDDYSSLHNGLDIQSQSSSQKNSLHNNYSIRHFFGNNLEASSS